MRQTMAILLALAFCSAAFGGYPETREYLLGHIDNFQYHGAGSVDDVYVDPGLWSNMSLLPFM
jgi:hypothetical protein